MSKMNKQKTKTKKKQMQISYTYCFYNISNNLLWSIMSLSYLALVGHLKFECSDYSKTNSESFSLTRDN